jgi:spore coat protein H
MLPPWKIALLLSVFRLTAQTPDELFDSGSLQEIRITMDATDWQLLHDRYLEDTVYPCSFAWNGYALPKIGIKSRGSQSRSPIKPSIGLDFSKYASTQRFAGLKTLVLRNLNQDASMMHEFLAERIFARMGLPHSREAFARLYVNEEYIGVYLMVEPIDARFVKVRLGEDNGYLYDMQNRDSPYRFELLGPDLNEYVPGIFDPKTNSAAPDAEGVMEMIRVVNEAADSDFAAAVGRHIDLDAALAHAAAETATANWDGFLGINGMRNFYMYRWNQSRRALLFGWDMDGAFNDAYWPLFTHAEKNILIRRALRIPVLRQRYIEYLDEAAHAIADGEWMTKELTRIYRQIQPSVYEDSNKLCRTGDGIGRCTNEMFEAEVRHLLTFAVARPRFVWEELAGETLHNPGAPDLHPVSAATLTADGPLLVPGGLAQLRTELQLTGPYVATGFPLPEELGGVTVETTAGRAPLVSVSPSEIVFVVPGALPCGPQTVHVADNGRRSNSLTVELRPVHPTVFAATHADGSLIRNEAPAQAGEWIVLYTTGATGVVEARANRAKVKVIWAGEAPGFAGMQQVILEMPATFDNNPSLRLIVDNESGPPIPLAARP